MAAPRYYLAKYIPDLQRQEPRNIGVIVWTDQGVAARFLAEKLDQGGEIDGRSIPSFIKNPVAYRQWIRYWQNELSKPKIKPITGGEAVVKTSPNFVSTLLTSNKENFLLVDGGYILEPIDRDELPRLTNYLFSKLVDTNGPEEPRDLSLDEVCENLIKETRLSANPNFYQNFELDCEIGSGTVEKFEFSYAFKNGSLQRLYHQVPLAKRRAFLKKTVDASAWMFEKVINSNQIQPEQGAVLIYANPEQAADTDVEKAISVLGSVTRVFNLNDPSLALTEFLELAAQPLH